jgi:hypothetical protein
MMLDDDLTENSSIFSLSQSMNMSMSMSLTFSMSHLSISNLEEILEAPESPAPTAPTERKARSSVPVPKRPILRSDSPKANVNKVACFPVRSLSLEELVLPQTALIVDHPPPSPDKATRSAKTTNTDRIAQALRSLPPSPITSIRTGSPRAPTRKRPEEHSTPLGRSPGLAFPNLVTPSSRKNVFSRKCFETTPRKSNVTSSTTPSSVFSVCNTPSTRKSPLSLPSSNVLSPRISSPDRPPTKPKRSLLSAPVPPRHSKSMEELPLPFDRWSPISCPKQSLNARSDHTPRSPPALGRRRTSRRRSTGVLSSIPCSPRPKQH